MAMHLKLSQDGGRTVQQRRREEAGTEERRAQWALRGPQPRSPGLTLRVSRVSRTDAQDVHRNVLLAFLLSSKGL